MICVVVLTCINTPEDNFADVDIVMVVVVTGSGVTGSGVTGPGVTGSGVTGSGVTGPGVTRSDVTGSDVTRSVVKDGVVIEEEISLWIQNISYVLTNVALKEHINDSNHDSIICNP